MNPIVQGLYISLVGIVVLFVVAAIFYFLLVGMQKLFPAKVEEEDQEEVVEVVKASAPSDEKAIVAAIAVALHLAQTQVIPGLGESLSENRSAWWSSKLMSAHKKSRQ